MTLRDVDVVGDWTAGPIVVTGPTGIGKTTWVAAHDKNLLIIKIGARV
jgi:Tfp pilus assembly pilus retraction ATPase PilT